MPTLDPLFTIVIPVYDRTRYVRESIYSALAQNFESFEVLVILDGSPDATRIVVEEIRGRHLDRMRVLSYSESSGTACRARNTGIMYARGEFISFLDSDDLASPIRLASTAAVFEKTKCDVAYGAVKFMPDEGRDIPGIEFGDVGYPDDFTMDDLVAQNRIYTLTVSARRDALLRHGGFRPEMRYREDHELWLRLFHAGCQFSWTKDVLSIYRIHGGNNELTFKPEDAHWEQMARTLYDKPFSNWGI